MSFSGGAKKALFTIQLIWFGIMGLFLLYLGFAYLKGDIRPAPAPVKEVIDYDQLYRNCMDSIKDYPSSMYDNAAENCAMIGSSAP